MKIPAGPGFAKIVILALLCGPAAAEDAGNGFDLRAILEAVGANHDAAVLVGGAGSGGAGVYAFLLKKQGDLAGTLDDVRRYKKLGFNEVQLRSLKAGDVVLFSAQDLAEFHGLDRLARPGVMEPLYFRFTDAEGRTSHLTANMTRLAQGMVQADAPVMEMRTGLGQQDVFARVGELRKLPAGTGGQNVADGLPGGAAEGLAGSPARVHFGILAAKDGAAAGGNGGDLLAAANRANIVAEENALTAASGYNGALGVPYQVGSAEARLGEDSGLVRALSIGGKYVRVARVAVVIAAVAVAYACYEYFSGTVAAPAVKAAPHPERAPAQAAMARIAAALRAPVTPDLQHGAAGGFLLAHGLGGGARIGPSAGAGRIGPPAPALPPLPAIRDRYEVGYYLDPAGHLVNFAL